MPDRFGSQLILRLAGLSTLAVGIVLCAGACSSASPGDSLQGTSRAPTLTIGFPFPTGQDPLRGATQAARLISLEGLSTQNLNGRPVPRLAEGWSESSDGLTWTIRLRPTALFHDGSGVDAAAVKDSLERFIKSPLGRSLMGLQDVASMEVSSRHVLTVRLKQRSTLFLDDLDSALITKTDAKGRDVGTGPYVVASTSTDELSMAAFPRYYRGIAAIDGLVWRLYPTVRTAWAAMMRGEVDFLYEVGPESREFLELETSVALYPFMRNYVYGVVFNTRHPALRDPEIRRALNYAVDRSAIVKEVFRGHATVANGPAWPLHWAYEADAASYPYDPARVAASLDRIVRSRRRAAELSSPATKFVCLIPENFQLWERLALMVQRDFAAIGIDMALEAVPAAEFTRRVEKGEFDLALTEMVSGFSASRQFFFWHSSAPSNFSGYRNAEVDAALEGIRHAADESEYRAAFHRFQQATFDDPPAIFLAWSETARAVSRRFDVVKAPGGDIRMTISDWTLAAKAGN
jgi:ABC-type transport system substrate-binding protein